MDSQVGFTNCHSSPSQEDGLEVVAWRISDDVSSPNALAKLPLIMKKNLKNKKQVIISKPIDQSKYYVGHRDNGDLYFFDKTSVNCWSRNPSKASPLSISEANEAVRQGKKSNLSDAWIIAPFESLFKNVLQDISDVLWGETWHDAFDIMSMKEEIGRLQAQEIKLAKQSQKINKLKKVFKSVIKTELLPENFE